MLRIAKLRSEKGISQAKLARIADVNASSLNRIENGKEPLYPVRGRRIADALGWNGDPDALLEEVGRDE